MFIVHVCTYVSPLQIYRSLHTLLSEYKDAKRGPTVVFIQSPFKISHLTTAITTLKDFPQVISTCIKPKYERERFHCCFKEDTSYVYTCMFTKVFKRPLFLSLVTVTAIYVSILPFGKYCAHRVLK